MLTPQSKNNSSNTNGNRSGTSTPDRIRFKAFPYSGINDYMIFCQQDFLSVGGGYVNRVIGGFSFVNRYTLELAG